jgi:hypothetical protein
MESQIQLLKNHFEKGRSITQLQASIQFGVGRLASRINDLIHEGYPIQSEFITIKKANGKKTRVKKYYKTTTIKNQRL